MFEKFTERTRKVMALANQEAQRCNHERIHTADILVGLLKEGSGVGGTILKIFGLDLIRLRSEVEKIVESGPEIVTMGKLPRTDVANTVIKYALEEAKKLNNNRIGTEHLLLGILRLPTNSSAKKILHRLKIKPGDIRGEVLNLLGRSIEVGVSAEKSQKKKEKPVKCVIFDFTEKIQLMRDSIEDFFATGKEFLQAVPLPDQGSILIFYREKK